MQQMQQLLGTVRIYLSTDLGNEAFCKLGIEPCTCAAGRTLRHVKNKVFEGVFICLGRHFPCNLETVRGGGGGERPCLLGYTRTLANRCPNPLSPCRIMGNRCQKQESSSCRIIYA